MTVIRDGLDNSPSGGGSCSRIDPPPAEDSAAAATPTRVEDLKLGLKSSSDSLRPDDDDEDAELIEVEVVVGVCSKMLFGFGVKGHNGILLDSDGSEESIDSSSIQSKIDN